MNAAHAVWSQLLFVVALISAVPAAVLALQALGAKFARIRRGSYALSCEIQTANVVLVPAHNESTHLLGTLKSVQAQLTASDELIVIADNCSDDTADVARNAGARVLTRSDASRRGKGYALEFGIGCLRDNPPTVVTVIDADCRLEPGCLAALVAQVVRTGGPAQGEYVMRPPANASMNDHVSAFAVFFKNSVRPRGMSALGFPCLVTGSGVAFPWDAIADASWGGSNIVEDMHLSVALNLRGRAPRFCPEARLTALLPSECGAARQQRTRWEHGHIHSALIECPRLLWGFHNTGRLSLLATMLDLAVLPLSLIVTLWGVLFCLECVSGTYLAAIVQLIAAAVFGMALGLAAFEYCRGCGTFRFLLAIPWYIASKLPVYFRFLYCREKAWIRTSRS